MERADRGAYSDAADNQTVSDDALLTYRVRVAAWCSLPVVGLIEAVFGRHAMQDDGVSYLDMGDAIVRGDWKMAFNGTWSPLYPLLEGSSLRLLKPNGYWQFTVVHAINFLIFLFALGSFDYLLRACVADHPRVGAGTGGANALPKWAVFAIGYAVFLWSSLDQISMRLVSPDMLMAGFIYLAVGLLLRIWEQPRNFSRFVLLGVVLGLGYLAKTPVSCWPCSFSQFPGYWRETGAPQHPVSSLGFSHSLRYQRRGS